MSCSPPLRIVRSGVFNVRAFSLVEVVIAVGIVSFAFVAILGLIPAGLSQFRQAIDTSVCSQIAQRVIMDAQQTDYETLVDYAKTKGDVDNFTFRAPTKAKSYLRYFNEQGNEIVPVDTTNFIPNSTELAQVVYQVNTRIGLALDTPGSYQGGDSRSIIPVTVEVIFNPGNRPLVFKPSITTQSSPDFPYRNLVDLTQTKGVSVKTYSALVGQNQ